MPTATAARATANRFHAAMDPESGIWLGRVWAVCHQDPGYGHSSPASYLEAAHNPYRFKALRPWGYSDRPQAAATLCSRRKCRASVAELGGQKRLDQVPRYLPVPPCGHLSKACSWCLLDSCLAEKWSRSAPRDAFDLVSTNGGADTAPYTATTATSSPAARLGQWNNEIRVSSSGCIFSAPKIDHFITPRAGRPIFPSSQSRRDRRRSLGA